MPSSPFSCAVVTSSFAASTICLVSGLKIFSNPAISMKKMRPSGAIANSIGCGTPSNNVSTL